MGIIIAIVLGGIIGWLASIVMKTDGQQGIILNVVVGIVGSFLGNIVAGMFGSNEGAGLAEFDLSSLLWAFLGAIVLLAIVNLFRRGSVR